MPCEDHTVNLLLPWCQLVHGMLSCNAQGDARRADARRAWINCVVPKTIGVLICKHWQDTKICRLYGPMFSRFYSPGFQSYEVITANWRHPNLVASSMSCWVSTLAIKIDLYACLSGSRHRCV